MRAEVAAPPRDNKNVAAVEGQAENLGSWGSGWFIVATDEFRWRLGGRRLQHDLLQRHTGSAVLFFWVDLRPQSVTVHISYARFGVKPISVEGLEMNADHCAQGCLAFVIGLLASNPASGQQDKPRSRENAQFEPYGQISLDGWPAFSPDDKQIIYTRFLPPEQGSIYTVSSRGGEPKAFPLEVKSSEGQPAWSPDGSQLAFTSNRSGQRQIWTANASGNDLKRITTSPRYHVEPCWSPDGNQIAYCSYPGPDIMVVPASGGESAKFASGFSPAWSPDGKQIAYYSEDSGPNMVSIFVKPLHGGEAKRLACSTTSPGTASRPSFDWSPDGQRLVAMKLSNGTWELAIINLAGDQVESTIPENGSALWPRWSHDGKQIVYASVATDHPYVVGLTTPDGKVKTEVTKHQGYTAAQLIRYRSADGLEIPSYFYLPVDSDQPNHAALVWLHGGLPGAILNELNPDIQFYVANGFVVLAPNYRSSVGFGEPLATLKPGDDIVQDVVAAVHYLKGLKSVNPSRIGVIGESFGGYLTLLTIARQPDLLAAAVDIAGLSDLTALYESPAYRQQLSTLMGGTPEQRPENYRAASPVTMAEQIRTPLLILHGDADHEAPYQQSVKMAQALKQAHKECDFVTYKHAGHGFGGKDKTDAMQQSLRFLLARLNAKP
jgi:dipeptidyl aminopeptidase/acylaminoacyl peptidase